MKLAVLVGHAQQFLLRVVFVLALPEAIGPLAEKRRGTSQFAVPGDDAVKFRAVEKVVVHLIGDFRAEVKRAEKTIVEAASRGVVPENSISIIRQKERNADVGVVLRKVHGFAAIVPNARLMLPEPVKRLVRTPEFREKLHMMGLFTINSDQCHRDFGLLE